MRWQRCRSRTRFSHICYVVERNAIIINKMQRMDTFIRFSRSPYDVRVPDCAPYHQTNVLDAFDASICHLHAAYKLTTLANSSECCVCVSANKMNVTTFQLLANWRTHLHFARASPPQLQRIYEWWNIFSANFAFSLPHTSPTSHWQILLLSCIRPTIRSELNGVREACVFELQLSTPNELRK